MNSFFVFTCPSIVTGAFDVTFCHTLVLVEFLGKLILVIGYCRMNIARLKDVGDKSVERYFCSSDSPLSCSPRLARNADMFPGHNNHQISKL